MAINYKDTTHIKILTNISKKDCNEERFLDLETLTI